jgi:hypothetical protein
MFWPCFPTVLFVTQLVQPVHLVFKDVQHVHHEVGKDGKLSQDKSKENEEAKMLLFSS